MKDILLDFLSRITSRKFLVTLAGIVLIILDTQYHFLDNSQRVSLVIVVVGYLTAEGAADVISRSKE